MAFSLFTPKNRIINLVLNDHSIRLLELKQVNPPSAQRWSERFLPPGVISDGKITDIDSLANILEECIDEWKIQRRQVRFIVPDQLVIIRKVSVPAEIQDDEMQGYLYLELGSSIHLPFEEPVFDFYPLANDGKTRELLIFAAPEQNVMEYANLLSKLKLNPLAADISPLAIYRLYYQLDHASEKEVLFSVQFDLTSVNLSIFEENVPLVMRQFALPFNMDLWDIKTDLIGSIVYKYIGDMDELVIQFEDIFREINKLIDFYRYTLTNEKHDITKFLLNGDHPMLKAIYDEMKERFEIPVDVISLEVEYKGKIDRTPISQLLPLGLALKGVQ
ncbi:Tfp pilus assembly protein, ATPase PilM [Neobacillus bataviensis LMG 21833]|uniref:Tfp pilus assembly protein, ATPase PilM n=1 Tax=Neobacillus bataviensis LMG 21833 TaxID=1117379 RepID=K6DYB2_9BACI|nr:pilus assembly protein PilM [Neobacillus bataviensis]EKN65861.1 Tfp pilus assembly protein, ATPase PilM [Neobacillus bataviensis LMG 21833]